MSQSQEQTFGAVIPSENFYPFHAAIYSLVEEVRWNLTSDGILAERAEPANVGHVQASLDTEAFDYFDSAAIDIGVSHSTLHRILLAENRDYDDAPDGQHYMFELQDPETLNVNVEDHLGTEYEYEFDILKSGDVRWISPPDVRFDTKIEIPAGPLKETIKRVRRLDKSKGVIIEVTSGNSFQLCSEGDGPHGFEWKGKRRDGQSEVVIVEDEPARSIYSTDYLEDMVAPIPDDTTVELAFNDEFLLRLSYEIAGGDGEVNYMLAPRIGGS